ncbi:MAG: SPOR domain-containing protein, partial [Legionellales bacterium]
NDGQQQTQGVVVPESYHVGAYHSPVSFKDMDQSWVSRQNPQGYTIEIADDAKASEVARKLYNTPKNDRMAQVQYQRNGRVYYKGVYGTYSSSDAAQKALDALPPDIKQGAGVKTWSSIQSN